MKKKLLAAFVILISVLCLMFIEYRFIMINIIPSVEGNSVYLEFMGQVDEYYIE